MQLNTDIEWAAAVRIDNPYLTPAAVYEVARLGADGKGAVLFYQEARGIVRGRNQPLDLREGLPVVRRPDGGKTWYHPHTMCLNITGPLGADEWYKRKSLQEEVPPDSNYTIGLPEKLWAQHLVREIEEYDSRIKPVIHKGEIYEQDRRRVISLSGMIFENTRVLRAATYNQDPTENIVEFLEADEISPSFGDWVYPLPSDFAQQMYAKLGGDPNNIIPVKEFVSEESMDLARRLQEEEKKDNKPHPKGKNRGQCVTMMPP